MQDLPPSVKILEILTARWLSQATCAAAQLSIADHLGGDALSLDDLARRVGAQPDYLSRLLRTLISAGIFEELADGRIRNSLLSDVLRADSPTSQKGAALLYGLEANVHSWTHIAHSVRTGESAFHHVYGKGFFDYLSEHPAESEIFNRAMTSFSTGSAALVADHISFAEQRTVVDVGGGHGFLLREILKKHAQLQGILFDLEQVVAGAAPAERMKIQAGSFFEGVPEQADCYLMKHILHDWDDERCRQILGHIHRAAAPEARLLIVDGVIKPGSEPHFGKLLDLEMMVMTEGGKERSLEQWRELLSQSGFRLRKVHPLPSPVSVLDASKD